LRRLNRKDWVLTLGLLGFLVLVVIGATDRAAKQRIGTDFHVFWQAGYDFAHGLPLYQRIPGARKFNYPPFAAQVFQLLGIFPLKTAAWLFYVASALLLLWVAKLSRDIIEQLEPSRRPGPLPLILALLCSLNFILNNLNMVQVNILVFTLCLLGIRAFIRDREPAASGWIVAATAIKLTPLFFVFWALIRGRRRTWAAMTGAGLLSLTLPMVQRGLSQGIVDLKMYYRTFLHSFAGGGVIPDYTNQNLASLVYRAVVPMSSNDTAAYDYAYLPSLEAAAPLIYRVLATTIFALFLGHLLRLRIRGRPFTALEISSVFLASHLLSGITWKAHLVTLLFVAYSFFALNTGLMSRGRRAAFALACAGIAAISLGRDVIGSRLHHYVGGYSLIVWVMLLLFVLSVVWSQKAGEKSVSGKRQA
jgi:hypothetical protein